MGQVGGVDYREYADIARVVGTIAECVELDRTMLVGARCRNILHGREFGSSAVLRRTSDTDLAIAIEDWAVFDRLHERFGTESSAWQRMTVSGIPTDIVPFGPIESPPGWIGRTSGDIELNVHGFADVFRAAERLYIDENVMIRLPTPAGYAVLKTHSWLDRIRKFEYKDAPDLALCVHWYANRADRLWGEAFWAMEEHNFDTHIAAAAVLGRDMGQLLGFDELTRLCTRLGSMDTGLLANYFAVDAADWPHGPERSATVEALFGELIRCKDSAR